VALVSRKASYGIRAMTKLAEKAEENESATIAWLAEQDHLPRKFLEQVARDLRRAKLIESKPGPGGGCRLARPPDYITVGQVLRALDGDPVPSHCFEEGFSEDADDCPGCWGTKTCAIHELWERLHDDIDELLDTVTISDLLARQRALTPRRALAAGK